MSSIITTVPAKSVVFEGVVVRCGYTPEQKAAPDWHPLKGEVCPNPLNKQDLGVMARYHHNPIINAWWQLQDAFKSLYKR